MPAYYTGEGATISFSNAETAGLNSKTYCVRSISMPSFDRDKIDVSCLDSSGFKEYIPSYLSEPGELGITVRFDGNDMHELTDIGYQGPSGTEMTCTLDFGLLDGETTAATLVGSGFIQNVSFSELNGTSLLELSISFCFDGRIDPTYTAGS
jgi:hypothetical protein